MSEPDPTTHTGHLTPADAIGPLRYARCLRTIAAELERTADRLEAVAGETDPPPVQQSLLTTKEIDQ